MTAPDPKLVEAVMKGLHKFFCEQNEDLAESIHWKAFRGEALAAISAYEAHKGTK